MLARLVFPALVVLAGALLVIPASAEGRPFPAGTSSHQLEGLNVSIVMPEEFDPEAERSMIVVLHGAGGTETGMAAALAFLAPQDYVVVAPKSQGQVWEKDDLERVHRIVVDLKARLRIGKGRLHGVGFSNGGWNLAPIAFDEELHFTTACWVAAGFNGGKVPKHAKKEMGVLALAGTEDGNRSAAEETPRLLRDDVRSADCRLQAGLDHKWPTELMPYYGWWVGAQEGRFTPGSILAYDWDAAASDPPAGADDGKSGAFVYWYASDDLENGEAKAFENETLMDASVLFFGRQLRAVRRDRASDEEAFAALKLKETPAIVVYDAKGKVKKTLSGDVKSKSLAAAFRSVAAVRKMDD